jgi:quaternary ammonium compound-resistance protein SugE
MNTSWILLLIAGILEACWAVGLKFTEGFSKPLVSAVVILTIIASMALLGLALRSLPVSTAYAVWVAIGIAGSTIGGAWLLGESLNLTKLFFLVLLLISVVGLKISSTQ